MPNQMKKNLDHNFCHKEIERWLENVSIFHEKVEVISKLHCCQLKQVNTYLSESRFYQFVDDGGSIHSSIFIYNTFKVVSKMQLLSYKTGFSWLTLEYGEHALMQQVVNRVGFTGFIISLKQNGVMSLILMYHSLIRHKHYSIKQENNNLVGFSFFPEFWKKQNKNKNCTQ